MAKQQEAVDNLLDALVWMRRNAKKKVAKKKTGKKRKKQRATR